MKKPPRFLFKAEVESLGERLRVIVGVCGSQRWFDDDFDGVYDL